MKKKKSAKQKTGTVFSILGTILLILIILLCIPATVPKLMGYKVYTVITGSMEPAIPSGSLVLVLEKAPETIETDEVIAYYSSIDTGSIITHRVVTNKTVSGEFITKGDANEAEDMLPVSYDNVIGVVKLSVPYLGQIMSALATNTGKVLAVCAIVAAILFHIVAGILKSEK